MAYPATRSMNADLREGATDGRYKKVTPNRGGVVETALLIDSRRDLNDVWYGIHEADQKAIPGLAAESTTPEYVATAQAQISV